MKDATDLLTPLFSDRHIGPRNSEIQSMLAELKLENLEQLIQETVPKNICLSKPLKLPEALPEHEFLHQLKELAQSNKLCKTYIGMGFNPCHTPGVIQRNILENPGWYTQYTPYQAEIAQGRLQALLNYQTMVIDLTGLEITNASLLDEATAAAEAMTMMKRVSSHPEANTFFVSRNCFPHIIDVLKTRAAYLDIPIEMGDMQTTKLSERFFGALIQCPDNDGQILDYEEFIHRAHEYQCPVAVVSDILSLVLLTSPGKLGADIALGSSQRFGVPLCYGGPSAAFLAAKELYKRHFPGRIIGLSVDKDGQSAIRMSLQTREQHIRREQATSNICTAQVLLAIMAGMYAVYHGPEGLKRIADRVYRFTQNLDRELQKLGFLQENRTYFDTLKVNLDLRLSQRLKTIAEKNMINFRYFPEGGIGITLNETTVSKDLDKILETFKTLNNKKRHSSRSPSLIGQIPQKFIRQHPFLTHPIFNRYQSETEMLRYIKQLENKDLALNTAMIPLGSCTMKLNATSEMTPITWPEFSQIHPAAPVSQTLGYQEMIHNLAKSLIEITGLQAVSFQPNSGAQGEYTGLLVIKAYHQDRKESQRTTVLIPESAHGTNPASAVMAGFKVQVVRCAPNGEIDLTDLEEKVKTGSYQLAALMITYPSTYGVFDENIMQVCQIIHARGGQVYLDGANLNAQVGWCSPGKIGADVCHINLHKTFCIPHGGGGPGMGPILVAKHLVPFLPNHPLLAENRKKGITAVSASPYGSAGILPISWAYIAMMGEKGLKKATAVAILNANYIAHRLKEYYPVLYVGKNGRVAHELILDTRNFKKTAMVEVDDIAKRLMDYGFHAPTVSFPVPGTLMVEPTESESKAELDRFCEAMIMIREEIRQIETGKMNLDNNVLKNAPHTAQALLADPWDHPYSREKAAYPAPWLKQNKFWPSVSRINNAYGDRNLICSCAPIETDIH